MKGPGTAAQPSGAPYRLAPRIAALAVSAILVASLGAGVIAAFQFSSSSGSGSESSGAISAQTAPASLDCATENAQGITLTLDSASSGIGGSQVELTVDGFDSTDDISVYMAADDGGELSAMIGDIGAGESEPAEVNVYVPLNYYAGVLEPYSPGQYYFWAEDADSNCASSSAFTLTAVPPAPLYCDSYAGSLTVSPSTGSTATSVNLSTANFYPEGFIIIYWATLDGSTYSRVADVTYSDPYAVGPYVPTGYAPGSYVFWAEDAVSECGGAPFTLTGSTVTPNVALSPNQGPVGTPFSVAGTEFTVSSLAQVEFGGSELEPTSCSIGTFSGVDISTSATGAFDCSFLVPAGLPASSYSVLGVDDSTGVQTPVQTFTVTTPGIVVSPLGGPVGATYVVTGTGFSVSSDANLAFEFVDQTPTGCTEGTFSGSTIGTTSSGSFECSFSVGSDAPLGYDEVYGVDLASNVQTQSALFEVTTLFLEISPSFGWVGSTFTVTGTGFTLGSAGAVVTFDGTIVVPSGGADCSYLDGYITLAGGGEFICNFMVPGIATPGLNPVQAEDINSGDLTPALDLSIVQLQVVGTPVSSPSGTTLEVQGAGWVPGDQVELGVGPVGASQATNATGTVSVGANGQFSCDISVSSEYLPPGAYEVFATDMDGLVTLPPVVVPSSNAFTLESPVLPPVPTIAVGPSAAPAGATFGLSGSGFLESSSDVSVTFDGEEIEPTGGPDCTVSDLAIVPDENGDFLCDFTVPFWAVTGSNIVETSDSLAVNELIFTVPQVETTSPSAPDGTVMSFEAPQGLGPDEIGSLGEFQALLEEPSVSGTYVVTTLPCEGGPFSTGSAEYVCVFSLPPLPSGVYSVFLIDPVTGAYGVESSFTVSTPSVSIGPTAAPVGGSVMLTATGLEPDANYAIGLGPPSVVGALVEVPFEAGSFTTASDGSYSGTFTVPSGLQGGAAYSVNLYQPSIPGPAGYYIASAATPLTVAIGLAFSGPGTNSGPVGSVVSVVGSGATPGDGGALLFYLSTTGEIPGIAAAIVYCLTIPIVAPDGSFSCAFVMPSVSSGTYWVAVLDTNTNNVGVSSNAFDLDASPMTISFSPPSGPAGTEIAAPNQGSLIPGDVEYALYLDPTQGVLTSGSVFLSTFFSGSAGTLPSGPFTVPGAVVSGTSYYLDIYQVFSGADYYIVSASDEFTATLASVVSLSSTSGAPGPFSFTVAGLAPDTAYETYLDSVGGMASSASYNPIGECSTPTTSGSLSCTATIPSGLSGGVYHVDLFQAPVDPVDSPQTSTPPSFILNLFVFDLVKPVIGVTPDQAPVAAPFLVVGSGFTPSSGASLSFGGVVQTPVICSGGTFVGGTITTNASGGFNCTFVVSKESAGTYPVTGYDEATGLSSPAMTFSITTLSLTFFDAQGPVGSIAFLTGNGFSAFVPLASLVFDKVAIAPSQCLPGSSLTANDQGIFSCAFAVPSGTSGTKVIATDVGGSTVSARFTVTVAKITVDPTQGPVGASVTVSGTGFPGKEPVTLTFDGITLHDQPGLCVPPGVLFESPTGAFSCTLYVPPGASGTSVTASDPLAASAGAKFTVTTLQLSVSPGHAPIGATVKISGSGFSVSSLVTVSFLGVTVGGSTSCVSGTSLLTGTNGKFSCSLVVPGSVDLSSETVTATDPGGNAVTTGFTVTAPGIKVSPTRGPVGALVTVTGTNFPYSTPVALNFDGVVLTSCSDGGVLEANTTGAFTCSFGVPSGTGDSTVTVESFYGQFATATFTVTTPKITLSAASGPVGKSVTVSGTGFSVSSPLAALIFDGVTITASECTSGSLTTGTGGSFSCTLTVPSGTSGTSVIAEDVGGQGVSATFTVTKTL